MCQVQLETDELCKETILVEIERSIRQVAIRALFRNICLCFGQFDCRRTKLKPVTKYTHQLIYISLYMDTVKSGSVDRSTEVRFASFLSGGFTTMAVINRPEMKLAKCTSVQSKKMHHFRGSLLN